LAKADAEDELLAPFRHFEQPRKISTNPYLGFGRWQQVGCQVRAEGGWPFSHLALLTGFKKSFDVQIHAGQVVALQGLILGFIESVVSRK